MTGTGTSGRTSSGTLRRWRKAAKISSTAALLLLAPGPPAITSRPDPSPPYTSCSSLTRPARSRCFPAAASPGNGANRVEATAAATGPVNGAAGC